MAKKTVDQPIEEPVKERKFKDYVFEHHVEGQPPMPIGLTMNYPTEAAKVKAWIEDHMEDLGYNGIIRICKKSYS